MRVLFLLILFSYSVFGQNNYEIVFNPTIPNQKVIETGTMNGISYSPEIVTDKDGNSLLLWERMEDPSNKHIKLRRSDGSIVYSKILKDGEAERFIHVGIQTNKKGLFLIYWLKNEPSGNSYYIEVIDSEGNLIVPTKKFFNVNSITYSRFVIIDESYIIGTYDDSDYVHVWRYSISDGEKLSRSYALTSGFPVALELTTYNSEIRIVTVRGNNYYCLTGDVNSFELSDPSIIMTYDDDVRTFLCSMLCDDNGNNYLVNYIQKPIVKKLNIYKFSADFTNKLKEKELIDYFEDHEVLEQCIYNDSLYITYSVDGYNLIEVNMLGINISNFDTSAHQNIIRSTQDFDKYSIAQNKDMLAIFREDDRLVKYYEYSFSDGFSDEEQIDYFTIEGNFARIRDVVMDSLGFSFIIYTRDAQSDQNTYMIKLDSDGIISENEKIVLPQIDGINTYVSSATYIGENRILILLLEWNGQVYSNSYCLINSYGEIIHDRTYLNTNQSYITNKEEISVISDSLAIITYFRYDGSSGEILTNLINLDDYSSSQSQAVNIVREYGGVPLVSYNTLTKADGSGAVIWSDFSDYNTEKRTTVYIRNFDSFGKFTENQEEVLFKGIIDRKFDILEAYFNANDSYSFLLDLYQSSEFYLKTISPEGQSVHEDVLLGNKSFGNRLKTNLSHNNDYVVLTTEDLAPEARVYLIQRTTSKPLFNYYNVNTANMPEIRYLKSQLVGTKINTYFGDFVEHKREGYFRQDSFELVLTGVDQEESAPQNFFLLTNYPNPFNPETTVQFKLPESGNVRLNVYNTLGELVTTLANGEMTAGQHNLTFNAAGLASGVYIARLDYDNGTRMQNKTIKMLVLK